MLITRVSLAIARRLEDARERSPFAILTNSILQCLNNNRRNRRTWRRSNTDDRSMSRLDTRKVRNCSRNY